MPMTYARSLGTALILLFLTSPALAGRQVDGRARKQARAVRVANGSIALDGRLEDEVWREAPAVGDFVQKEPVEGVPPTESIEVRFAYDDDAFYVGARMFSRNPDAIQAPMSRRDDVQQAEYLLLSLDTYLDHRTAYTFGVTASGVRLDQYHPADEEANADLTYDPVWRARTRVDDRGWTAEFWLPFSQLRFNRGDELVWGLNLHRWIPTLKEDDYWVLVPRTERGWASQFGELRGIERVAPPRRMELLPYTSASSRLRGNVDPANPFDDRLSAQGRIGLDAKFGVGPNLTLDATVNPDFGQVDADPAEVNLSTTETQFAERRPFFLEGARLLTGGTGTSFVYSRRIGAPPLGPAPGDFVERPDTTTILGAAKLTGRLASGMSLAALGAVTGEEFAKTALRSSPLLGKTLVTPRASYAAARVQQEFGRERNTAGLLLTTMHRDLEASQPLSARFPRSAFTGVLDSVMRFADRTYQSSVNFGFSHVEGEPAALERIQRGTVHFFQRPDRPGGTRLDPTRRSLSGTMLLARVEKIGGRHWLGFSNFRNDSPELDTNDIGRLGDAGTSNWTNSVTYRETVPGRIFRAYSSELAWRRDAFWDDEIDAQFAVTSTTQVTWPNFWTTKLNVFGLTRGMTSFLTRGGPVMGLPRSWNADVTLANSNSSETHWSMQATFTGSEDGDHTHLFNGRLSLRPAPAWQLSLDPIYRREVSTRQYVTQLSGGRAETFGGRYIFGTIDRSTVSTQIRLNYTFRPDLNLDLYAEPFAASGRYDRFGELLAPGSRFRRIYGEGGTTMERGPDGTVTVQDGAARFTIDNRDFNVLSFRSNLVLRWEWRPGSTLYLVWQQNRSSTEATRERAGLGDLFGSISAPGDNFFAVKASFWISPR